jgi:hypothetical protein
MKESKLAFYVLTIWPLSGETEQALCERRRHTDVDEKIIYFDDNTQTIMNKLADDFEPGPFDVICARYVYFVYK